MSVIRSPISPWATPVIDTTPPRGTAEHRSGTVIPETPIENESPSGYEIENAMPNNTIQLLTLLGNAITKLSTTKCTGNNQKIIENAKGIIEEAKHITLNLLKEDENKRNKTTEQMLKDLNDIKKLLVRPAPSYAQATASEPPTCHHETPVNRKRSSTDNSKTKKQQCDKLTITIAAAEASDTTKN